MENFFNNLAYFSSLALLGLIAIICFIILLVWLFISSAVASGTKKGIIDAYNAIHSNNSTEQTKINTSMFDKDEKSYIFILLLLLIIGLIVVYMFL